MEGNETVNRIYAGEIETPAAQDTPATEPQAGTDPVITDTATEPAPEVTPAQATPAEVVAAQPTPEYDPYEALGLPKGGGEYKKFFEAAKAGKDEFKKFVDVAFTDYDSLPDQTVLRAGFDKKHAQFTQEERDLLFEDHMQREYGLTGDENQDRIGLLRMKAAALDLRNALKEEQAGYRIPEVGGQPTPQPQTASKEYLELTAQLAEHPALKQFETNRLVSFGSGEEAYNFEVSPDVPVSKIITENMGLLFQPFIQKDATGKLNVDVARIAKLAAYAHNMDKVEDMLLRHGAKMGEKHFIDKELKYKQPDNNGTTPPVTHVNRIY